MKLMISQPMRTKTNRQIKEERKEIIRKLLDEGYEVLDTVIDDFVCGYGNDYAIRCLSKSISFIADVDGVVFMNGWENARGCRIEHQVAKEYGKFIKYL